MSMSMSHGYAAETEANFPSCTASRLSSQTITAGVDTKVALDAATSEADLTSMFDAGNNRINISVPGLYLIAGALGQLGYCMIYVNGSEIARGTSGVAGRSYASCLKRLASGDYVELYVNSTTTVTNCQGFNVTRIGS